MLRHSRKAEAVVAAVAVASGCRPLLMESKAFEDGGIVPQKYAGRDGVQPGFTFSNAPENTVSYAIIFHDLDVALMGDTGDVLHWIAWNIPASAKGIPEGSLPAGSVTGKNIAGITLAVLIRSDAARRDRRAHGEEARAALQKRTSGLREVSRPSPRSQAPAQRR